MAEQTIYVYAKSGVTITHADGSPTNTADILGASLWGNAFSWENPNDLTITLPTDHAEITFEDSDGVISDDPFSGSQVTDQLLTAPATIDGTTYTPSTSDIRWQNPAPVNVENEFQVTLFGPDGTSYTMLGISITEGYSTNVVGVTFAGGHPPPGTTLTYIRGESSYGGSGGSTEISDTVPCFLAGTRIDTARGAKAVEELRAGDLVQTLDRGLQPLRWVGASTVCGLGPQAPILLRKGALGNHADLYVSPNHRILVRAAAAEFYYGSTDVLVPAKALVDGRGIRPAPRREAQYIHLLLPRHEMVFSEGLASESLFTGAVAIGAFDETARGELLAVMKTCGQRASQLNRPALSVQEARALLALCRTPERGMRAA
ncbi:Hint domain-containing protein [Maritimibacter sp. UBA3975]|uniref:Hint domain-containing protein n=1 Tax=Maritimibacter sp. UBA3975 TaxID=1946833 RepID=UPI0025C53433|nr:Hint domain-containing protein [Maritimibacter sp. UBA3975]|tara:strand:+ start:4570 stop:5691 length:1122 start_codon:yes stop_codon:yes gene_type:complete